jgi:flagellar basal body-associated protein FliL
MNETQPNPGKPTKSATWLIGLVIVAILVVAVIIFLLLNDDSEPTNTNQSSNSAVNRSANTNALVNQSANTNDSTVNTNALVNQSANTNDSTVNTNTAATNTANPDEVTYLNPEFGYSVRYADPTATHSTAVTSNTAENLYSQWVLSEGSKAVVTIQVFQKDGITDSFSARKYSKTSATVALAKLSSNVLTVDGVKRGLTFDYGIYTFVLLAADKQGTDLYAEFETIAKTLSF